MKQFFIAFFSIVALWLSAALFMHQKTAKLEKEYIEKSVLLKRYETLKGQWSESAQKKALKKFETLLRLYNISPEVTKKRNRRVYTFTLDIDNADKVIDKLLNGDLALQSLDIERKDGEHLQVRVGVPL